MSRTEKTTFAILFALASIPAGLSIYELCLAVGGGR